ncbi:MAG: hypothetical protein ACOY4O_08460 [Pseudomonadota bacterium]
MTGCSSQIKAAIRRAAPLGAILALAFAVSGCASGNQASLAFASVGPPGSATIAFESIDGPPPQVFERLVRAIDSESQTRSLAVVSREAAAAYRVRTYLSAQVRRGKTVIAWVWDVYDRNQERAIRLSGEETAGKPGRDAWAVADDALLRRIAQSGLSGLAGLINGTAPAEPAPSPDPRGPAVASVTSGEIALGYSAN